MLAPNSRFFNIVGFLAHKGLIFEKIGNACLNLIMNTYMDTKIYWKFFISLFYEDVFMPAIESCILIMFFQYYIDC